MTEDQGHRVPSILLIPAVPAGGVEIWSREGGVEIWSREVGMWFRRTPRVEPLPEPDFGPELERFHNGLAVLLRDGEPVGHVASSLGYFTTRGGRQPWIWLVVVWSDGTKEESIEDYAPWTYVAEMRAGYLDWDGGSGRITGRKHSHVGRYEIEWLPRDRAVAEREQLGVRLKDF